MHTKFNQIRKQIEQKKYKFSSFLLKKLDLKKFFR